MKKITLLFILFFAFVFGASAQYYYVPYISVGKNPSGLNTDNEYPVGGGIAAGWSTLMTTSASPSWSTSQALPFTFSFNGGNVTSYRISTTGILTFGSSTIAPPSSTPSVLPSASIPDSSICVWGIQATGSNDDIVTKTFGTAPNRQFWIQFSSYSDAGNANDYNYWSIVLEETTNKIYIVDNRSYSPTSLPSLTLGIQINSTTATNVAGSPAVHSFSNGNPTVADNSYYEFNFGTQPAIDIAGLSAYIPPYVKTNSPFTLSGTVMNVGTANVTTMDMNFSDNGGTVQTTTLSSLSIASLAKYNFNLAAIPFTPTTVGIHHLKIWATNINSLADQNNSNDTIYVSTAVIDSVISKMALFEEFNQASCDPCAAATPNLDSVLGNCLSKCNAVRYHVNWPGRDFMDSVTLGPFVQAQVTYYGVTGVPDGKLDGAADVSPASMNSSLIYQEAGIGSPFRISLNGSFNMATQTYSATANVKAFAAFNSGLKLKIALTVDTITYANNQSTESIPQTVFPQVAEAMLPSSAGTTLTAFTSGQTQTVNTSWVKNHPWASHGNTWHYDSTLNVHLTAWVQDNTTKYIYQSETFKLTTTSPNTGIASFNNEVNSVNIYPNPTKDDATLSINLKSAAQVGLEVYDLLGKVVYSMPIQQRNAGLSSTMIDFTNLSNGIYFAKITVNNQVTTEKISVVK